jgi:hypothetical protein
MSFVKMTAAQVGVAGTITISACEICECGTALLDDGKYVCNSMFVSAILTKRNIDLSGNTTFTYADLVDHLI